MTARWRWPALLVALVVLALLLCWLDASLFERTVLPGSRRILTRGDGLPRPAGFPPRGLGGTPFGPFPETISGALFSLGWFAATALGLVALAAAMLVAFPARARLVVDRLDSLTVAGTALVAGLATVLLLFAFSFLLRLTIVLLPLAGALSILAALGALFGIACLALWLAGQARLRIGPAHPLLIALTALVAFADLALIPFAGLFLLGLLAVTGLGLTVLTRFGSPRGWAMDELDW
ncbi:MAG: hypothetical protein E6J02_00765 [Chloroflexi bacterium]|nr:MAG: hypothetical protein E6J02_00765 [Chloroflexota bacterium]TME14851.1 MAG: hypothetical protein E6I63_11640 [Chloroflexota bacterium]